MRTTAHAFLALLLFACSPKTKSAPDLAPDAEVVTADVPPDVAADLADLPDLKDSTPLPELPQDVAGEADADALEVNDIAPDLDADAPDETADEFDLPDTPEDLDVVDSADSDWGEFPADETSDEVSEAGGLSDQYLEDLCQDLYCANYAGCLGDQQPENCVDGCLEQAAADEEFLKRLACASAVPPFLSWCSVYEECTGDWAPAEPCDQHCANVEACGVLGKAMWGYTQADCKLTCSAFWNLGAEAQEEMACMFAAFADCSGTQFQDCLQPGENPCQYHMCDIGWANDCGLIPEFYPDIPSCLDTCGDWNLGQITGWFACDDLWQLLGMPCGEATDNCLQLGATLPAGALEYCTVIAEKCPPGEDYLGLLSDEICAWEVAGLAALLPGLANFTGAAECASQWTECPPETFEHPEVGTLPRLLTCVVQ